MPSKTPHPPRLFLPTATKVSDTFLALSTSSAAETAGCVLLDDPPLYVGERRRLSPLQSGCGLVERESGARQQGADEQRNLGPADAGFTRIGHTPRLPSARKVSDTFLAWGGEEWVGGPR